MRPVSNLFDLCRHLAAPVLALVAAGSLLSCGGYNGTTALTGLSKFKDRVYVSVQAVDGEQVTVLELRVAPNDLGKVIGKQGRTARSIRTILSAAGMKLRKRFTLEILE